MIHIALAESTPVFEMSHTRQEPNASFQPAVQALVHVRLRFWPIGKGRRETVSYTNHVSLLHASPAHPDSNEVADLVAHTV
jgi:hypothetical protein